MNQTVLYKIFSNSLLGWLGISLLFFIVYEGICMMSFNFNTPDFFVMYLPFLIADLIRSFILGGFAILGVRISKFFYSVDYIQKGKVLILIPLFFLFDYLISFCYVHLENLIFQTPISVSQELFISFGISIILTLVTFIYLTLNISLAYIQEQRKHEEANKLSILARLEALQYQINPHFLFNNLNVLSELIEEDKNLAFEFINHMASVYRHTLQSEKSPVIPLSEELKFLSSYIYLLKIRLGDSIEISFEDGLHDSSFGVASDTLMLLIENAIKHNKMTQTDPLKINIYMDKDHLVILNDYRPIKKYASTHKGIKNIAERYYLLNSSYIINENVNDKYIVKLPKLNLKNEYSNY